MLWLMFVICFFLIRFWHFSHFCADHASCWLSRSDGRAKTANARPRIDFRHHIVFLFCLWCNFILACADDEADEFWSISVRNHSMWPVIAFSFFLNRILSHLFSQRWSYARFMRLSFHHLKLIFFLSFISCAQYSFVSLFFRINFKYTHNLYA